MESETLFASNIRSNVRCVSGIDRPVDRPLRSGANGAKDGNVVLKGGPGEHETKECREAMSWYQGDCEWVSKEFDPETEPGERTNNWMFDCWRHQLAHPLGVDPQKVIRVNYLVQPSSGFMSKLMSSDEKPGRVSARYRLLAVRAAIHLSLERLTVRVLNVLVGGRSLSSFLSEFRWFEGEVLNFYTSSMSDIERENLVLLAQCMGIPAKVCVLDFMKHTTTAMDLVVCGFGNGGIVDFGVPLHIENNLCGYVFQGAGAKRGPVQDMILGWALTPAGKSLCDSTIITIGTSVTVPGWDHDSVGGILNIPPPLALPVGEQCVKQMARLEGKFSRFGVYAEGDGFIHLGPYGQVQCSPVLAHTAGYHVVYLCGEVLPNTWRVICPCGIACGFRTFDEVITYGKIIEFPVGVLIEGFGGKLPLVSKGVDLDGPCILVDPYRCGDGAFVFKTEVMSSDQLDTCFLCATPILVSNHPDRFDVVGLCECHTMRVLSPGRGIDHFVKFGHRAFEGSFVVAPLDIVDPACPVHEIYPQGFDLVRRGPSSFVGDYSPPLRLHFNDAYEMYQRAGTLLVMLFAQPKSEYWRYRGKLHALLMQDDKTKLWDLLCQLRSRLGRRAGSV
jgi:hypothetical protein